MWLFIIFGIIPVWDGCIGEMTMEAEVMQNYHLNNVKLSVE